MSADPVLFYMCTPTDQLGPEGAKFSQQKLWYLVTPMHESVIEAGWNHVNNFYENFQSPVPAENFTVELPNKGMALLGLEGEPQTVELTDKPQLLSDASEAVLPVEELSLELNEFGFNFIAKGNGFPTLRSMSFHDEALVTARLLSTEIGDEKRARESMLFLIDKAPSVVTSLFTGGETRDPDVAAKFKFILDCMRSSDFEKILTHEDRRVRQKGIELLAKVERSQKKKEKESEKTVKSRKR